MTTEKKLQIHDVTSKAALCYGSENWIINKTDTQKLEAVQIRFLSPLLGLIRLARQRNPHIRDRFIASNHRPTRGAGQTAWKKGTEASFPN
jgi:hypothetical protein